ncbi:MAG: very short patch repair endonuclease [Phenylobacterium sp.]|uniref:very short patch repair endonuclease n=1 Tax=Phenylobacterium sp. TaxID=1871053 RepID=UPI00271C70E9|nr:very short patch repair endonuclease [Phenylobacterium sp.]MDO8900527.1 very short patch repair endonuclease [Phenylobacterium sp.]
MDRLSPERRSANMRAIRSRNTKPEIIVRSAAFRAGYRYRLHDRGLPGSPDLVFPKRRKVIFVHGCFWHSHEGCAKAYRPKSRAAFWSEKFRKNRERDGRVLLAVNALGWEALVVWECEAVDSEVLRRRLVDFLGPPRIRPADR